MTQMTGEEEKLQKDKGLVMRDDSSIYHISILSYFSDALSPV